MLVLEGIHDQTSRDHHWRQILKAAGLAGVSYKDLRDTFASQLVTRGMPIGYASLQLGHWGIEITSTHYARLAGGDVYPVP